MQHHDSGHWKGWALKISTSFVPFQGPKKSQFSGPTPSNAPRNDVAPLKIIMYRAIKTTGTLIVIFFDMLTIQREMKNTGSGGAVCKGATPSVEQPGGHGFKPWLQSLLD